MGGKKNKNKSSSQSNAASSSYHQNNSGKGAAGVQGATASAVSSAPVLMECVICSETFDTEDHKPRNLTCGHSFCTTCCKKLNQRGIITCPKCRMSTTVFRSDEELPVNYLVLEMISNNPTDDSRQIHTSPPQTSPHGGKCLEAQAEIAMHCAYCHMWLCKDCSRIDHRGRECLLTPFQDTKRDMRQASMAKVRSTESTLKEFSRTAEWYDGKLRSFTALMEVALDCAKREQNHLAGLRIHSQDMEQELCALSEKSLPDDLEEALLFIKGMKEATDAMQAWAKDASAFLKREQVFKLSKALLQTAVQMHLNHSTTQASPAVLALHNIKGRDVTLPLEMDRGRLLVHAAAPYNEPPQPGCRVLKFEHIKSCIDPARALTFLDISLAGHNLGRMFIRLLGTSKRSLAFLMMCTGEAGSSYLNTRFHRILWPNMPGEHLWGGDYDHGDGNGGALPTEIVRKTVELRDNKTSMDIKEGLIAGRFGKSNSTIFRIYTKSSDTKEEDAFARVEYGFHILKEAIGNSKAVTDIAICGCGVVVEP